MDERLEQLVAEFVERRESGEDLSPLAFADAHPAHRERLLELLDSLHRVEGMFPDDTSGMPAAIGGWQVVRELGRGGIGRVFEVVRSGGGPARALKLLHASAALDPRQGERFRREAAILRDFDLPGAVRVHEVGEDGGCPFLVMDLVDGRSLAAVVQAARDRVESMPTARGAALADRLELPGPGTGAARAARLLAAVARTIAAAHRHGLVHRDLKPSNVLLRADGTPVVIDFGLARDAGAATLTNSGDVLGTPHFMAPEQAAGQRGDHRVDVYGLAAILYELLTLQVPHPGSDPFAVLHAARSAPPRPPRSHDPRIPKALDAIVRRAMALRPERRFADADRLAAALEAFAGGRHIGRTLSAGNRLEDLWYWHRRKVAALATVLLVASAAWAIAGAKLADRARRAEELVTEAAAARLQDRPRARQLAAAALDLADWPIARYLAGAELEATALGTALRAADAAMAAGDPARAMAAYHRARETGGQDGPAAGPMAGLLAGLEGLAAAAAGETGVAVRELTVAARAFPQVERLQALLADLHAAAGRHAVAACALEAVARLTGNDPEPWHRAAVNRIKAGTPEDRAQALRDVERALELAGDPPPPGYLRSLAAAVDTDRPHESVRILSKLLERYPDSANLHHNLAYVLHKQHRLAPAAQHYAEAVRLDPEYEPSLASLAWIHAGLDDTCAQCEASLDAHPELLDPERAARHMLDMMAIDGGRRPGGVETMVQVAQRIGRQAELARAIRGWLERPDLDERHLGRLAKALQKLK